MSTYEITSDLSPEEERRVDAAVEKVLRNVMEGRPEPTPLKPDSKDIAEVESDQQQGLDKRPEDWRQVMEYHGFTWYEPGDLNRVVGPEKYIPKEIEGAENTNLYWTRPHSVGQWRNDIINSRLPEQLKMAFTVKDLITGFGTPQVFDEWIRAYVLKQRAFAAGIKLL